MITLQLTPAYGRRDTARRLWWYHIAGHAVVADSRLPALSPFATEPGHPPDPLPWSPRDKPAESAEPADSADRCVFDGTAWVGRADRAVTCYAGPGGYRITVSGIGTYYVTPDGRACTCLARHPHADPETVDETVIGPVLVLALALQGVFCVHAGAVAIGDGSVAFLGQSGRGKSTLAGWLDNQRAVDCVRVADDILPLTTGDGAPVVRPRFPQLKLPDDQQVPMALDGLALRAAYILDTTAEAAPTPVSSSPPLGPADALLAIAEHTVAVRLFGPALSSRHMAFAASVAGGVPVRRLRYPRRRAALAEVWAVVAREIEE